MSSLYQKIIPRAIKLPVEKKKVSDLIKSLEEVSDNQISLDIKVKKKSRVNQYTGNYAKLFSFLNTHPYWKQFHSVSMIATSLISIGIFMTIYIIKFKNFPENIPVYFNHYTNTWSYTNKDMILIVPLSQLIVLFVLHRLNTKIFKFDRRLVQILNWSISLINVIFIISMYNIYLMLFSY